MLTAAVSGSIFASPSVAQIVSAISRVQGAAGTILIIKNYTGDVLHFHLAAEKARVTHGAKVEVLVVGDDVSVGRTRSGKVGRRGLAGTVLVHKVLGAMSSEPSRSFEDVLAMGKRVVERLVTVGVSLGHVQVPGRDNANDLSELGDDQIELGMGIHNEPGHRVISPRPSLPVVIDMMLDQLLKMGDPDRSYVDFSDSKQTVLLVNNLGGVSPLEFGGITAQVVRLLGEYSSHPLCTTAPESFQIVTPLLSETH
jgi:dihydroxyacetone kinase